MGIKCEINLFKPADRAFAPGSILSGAIKYSVDEETSVNNITVSLKGSGNLTIKNMYNYGKGRYYNVYKNKETYVDIDNVIHDNKCDGKVTVLPVGSYEIQFSFKLPNDIPASLKYRGTKGSYRIKCDIVYYIRIKFDRSGLFSTAKRFKNEFTVVTRITPALPMAPTICGEKKILTQLFSSRTSIVDIKSTIQNCVVAPGRCIDFNYEVNNDTNITVNGVETKLVEIYKFTSSSGNNMKTVQDISCTDSKTGPLKSGDSRKIDVQICIPLDRSCLENSKMVSRSYAVLVIVEIPLPHRNAVLEIPVQIGETDTTDEAAAIAEAHEPPPSYWEVMGEENRDSDGEDIDNEKLPVALKKPIDDDV